MTNGDKIRIMSDEELSEFMKLCERQAVYYYQHDCKECTDRRCDDCRMAWLKSEGDGYGIVLKTIGILFPHESEHKRMTLAGEVYKQLRRKDD